MNAQDLNHLQEKIALLESQIQKEKTARQELQKLLQQKAQELTETYQRLEENTRNFQHKTIQLQTSELNYKTIIENMSLGLLEVDQDHIILKAYDVFCEMIGYTQEELIGKNALQLFIPEEYQAMLDGENDRRKEGQPSVYEVELITKNGNRIWVIISGVPIFDTQNNVIGSLGIHYDITASKNLQKELENAKLEAESAQQAEKQFLANMSHEIRTPLNAIIGMTQLLSETSLSTEQQDYLDVLQYSANILKSLISDILDFSRIESGNIELQLHTFDLRILIDTICRTFAHKLEGKAIKLSYVIDETIPAKLVGDSLILNQILLNLLENAVKFTTQGSIEIEVRLLSSEQKLHQLQFCIADTGIGISLEEQKTIFQNYRQAKSDTKMLYGGSGLGLAITQQLVLLQEGEIWVESQEGLGSKFYVSLLYTSEAAAKQHPNLPQDSNPQAANKINKILVVEDNQMNQKYLSSLLNKWNCTFDLVDNGKEAVHLTLKEKYGLILLDLQMPVMNGFDACSEIRKVDNPNRRSPIIALTASAILKDKRKAFAVGMNDFLTKPFTPEELHQLISKFYPLTTPMISKHLPPQTSYEIDHQHLSELYMDDWEYALEMFDLFLDYGKKEVKQLDKAFAMQEWPEVKRLAHKLKPSFSMVGFPQLGPLLERLEEAVLNLQTIKIEQTYEKVRHCILNIMPIIKKNRDDLSTTKGDFFNR